MSVPFIGKALLFNKDALRRLNNFVDGEDEIRDDIHIALDHMRETEEITARLKLHIENKQSELEDTLEEDDKYKALASVEEESAKHLISQLQK